MPEGLQAPPERLDRFAPRSGETFTLPARRRVWRIYTRQAHGASWDTFRRHGPTDSRFDHHLHGSNGDATRSILYAAEDWATCVAEVFQDLRLIDTHARDPWLVAFTFKRDLRLLDVAGLWPTRAGGSSAINSGDRRTARAWSRAIYDAFPDIAGLRYGSAMHAGNTAYAFYDRAAPAVSATPVFHVPLSHPEIAEELHTVADTLGYDII